MRRIQVGSKYKTPNSFRVQNLHAVFEKTLDFCTRVWCVAAEPFTDIQRFCFFRHMFGLFCYFGYWVLKDPAFPAKKNKKQGLALNLT